MEILKKTLIACLLLLQGTGLVAQTNAVLQKAFRNSYTNELNKNYTAAITDIMPYYAEGSYELNIRLGWLYYLNKNYNASQTYYQKAVDLRPGAIEPKFGFIKALAFLQNTNKIAELYNAIIKIDPQNTQANYWLGIIYYNRKQFDAAAKCFRTVVGLYPFDYDGNHMLGWSLLMGGRKADAKSFFEKALIIKPGDDSSTDGLNRSR